MYMHQPVLMVSFNSYVELYHICQLSSTKAQPLLVQGIVPTIAIAQHIIQDAIYTYVYSIAPMNCPIIVKQMKPSLIKSSECKGGF